MAKISKTKKPEPKKAKLDLPSDYIGAHVLLWREVGKYAFALLDDGNIEKLVDAVAKSKSIGFIQRREAWERENAALIKIRKEN